ncbi:hypothetical protein E2C01_009865 [Portunus trituberculatus]|uniref:Uncharacterized protein n=1 Tax=Portunus trituberculatus TaxID=210409 RepID=A0A5B7D6V5_PORTR|nr:hypothetical protein [Portunus trituberculatus]
MHLSRPSASDTWSSLQSHDRPVHLAHLNPPSLNLHTVASPSLNREHYNHYPQVTAATSEHTAAVPSTLSPRAD